MLLVYIVTPGSTLTFRNFLSWISLWVLVSLLMIITMKILLMDFPSCLVSSSLVQAIYFSYIGDLSKALDHFLECANWQKAHSVFLTSVAHSLFLSGRELIYYFLQY